MISVLKTGKRIGQILVALILLVTVVTVIYMRQPQFGKSPAGERLALIKKSPHFKNNKFHNLVEKPTLSEGYSVMGELYKFIFTRYPRRTPVDALPAVKTNLLTLPADSNLAIWFGHSSVFIQLNGKRILVDPIFSKKATPLPWGVAAYKGTCIYSAADMPAIDYLLISHDHYDHLDYETVLALKNKVKHVVCGLGVGAHLSYWGYTPEQIIEKDWYEKVIADSNFTIYTASSHHESNRGFIRGETLWMSYLIQTPAMKIYISGDGGYDDRFKTIAQQFGAIDWAIMEDGQYDSAWHSVHLLPEEVLQATLDLQAKNLLPVHNSKFTLGKHPWDEPLVRIRELSKGKAFHLATPEIGEVINLQDTAHLFKQWWQGIR
jgi:L-ascorbate metabolism protein UlaG (beta-lactamase superfamily)